VTLGAYEHEEVPFERLVEELEVERELSRTPLFEVMVVLQNMAVGELRLPGLQLSLQSQASEVEKFDLTVAFSESEEGLSGEISYARDLYEEATVRRLGEHLGVMLAAVAGDG